MRCLWFALQSLFFGLRGSSGSYPIEAVFLVRLQAPPCVKAFSQNPLTKMCENPGLISGCLRYDTMRTRCGPTITFGVGFPPAGVMKRSDLSQIFRSERFPANLMSQYVNLLSKFEVALPWSPEFLLVPSLLPDSQQDTNQPVAAGVSKKVAQAMHMTAYTRGKVLRRQYVMSYVPSGFWPRLITR